MLAISCMNASLGCNFQTGQQASSPTDDFTATCLNLALVTRRCHTVCIMLFDGMSRAKSARIGRLLPRSRSLTATKMHTWCVRPARTWVGYVFQTTERFGCASRPVGAEHSAAYGIALAPWRGVQPLCALESVLGMRTTTQLRQNWALIDLEPITLHKTNGSLRSEPIGSHPSVTDNGIDDANAPNAIS